MTFWKQSRIFGWAQDGDMTDLYGKEKIKKHEALAVPHGPVHLS
ncbi:MULTISPECIES: hypothetical protein [Methylobacter]